MKCADLSTCISCLQKAKCWWVRYREEDGGVCLSGREVAGATYRQLAAGKDEWKQCPGLPPQLPAARANAFEAFTNYNADSYALFIFLVIIFLVAIGYLLWNLIIYAKVKLSSPSPYRLPQPQSRARSRTRSRSRSIFDRGGSVDRVLRSVRDSLQDLLPETREASLESVNIREEEVTTMTLDEFVESTNTTPATSTQIHVELRRSTRVKHAPRFFPATERIREEETENLLSGEETETVDDDA